MCAVDAMHVQVHREWGAAGIRAVAPAHLPHPRVAGRRIMEPPLCTRPSVFSPGFFHRLATRRGAAGAPFVDRIRVGVRVSRLETIPFGSHARTICRPPAGGRQGGRRRRWRRAATGRSSRGLPTKDLRARLSIRNHIKLLNYPPLPPRKSS